MRTAYHLEGVWIDEFHVAIRKIKISHMKKFFALVLAFAPLCLFAVSYSGANFSSLYSLKDGDWYDPNVWSRTEGGASLASEGYTGVTPNIYHWRVYDDINFTSLASRTIIHEYIHVNDGGLFYSSADFRKNITMYLNENSSARIRGDFDVFRVFVVGDNSSTITTGDFTTEYFVSNGDYSGVSVTAGNVYVDNFNYYSGYASLTGNDLDVDFNVSSAFDVGTFYSNGSISMSGTGTEVVVDNYYSEDASDSMIVDGDLTINNNISNPNRFKGSLTVTGDLHAQTIHSNTVTADITAGTLQIGDGAPPFTAKLNVASTVTSTSGGMLIDQFIPQSTSVLDASENTITIKELAFGTTGFDDTVEFLNADVSIETVDDAGLNGIGINFQVDADKSMTITDFAGNWNSFKGFNLLSNPTPVATSDPRPSFTLSDIPKYNGINYPVYIEGDLSYNFGTFNLSGGSTLNVLGDFNQLSSLTQFNIATSTGDEVQIGGDWNSNGNTMNLTFTAQTTFQVDGNADLNFSNVMMQNNAILAVGGDAIFSGVDFTLQGTLAVDGCTKLNDVKITLQNNPDLYLNCDAPCYTTPDPGYSTKTLTKGGVSVNYSGTATGMFVGSPGSLSCDASSVLLPSVLPVVLSYFSVGDERNGVSLYWETSSEANNDYFLLYRSADGDLYKEIAKLTGAGNSSVANIYSYKDYNSPSGIVYYKLTQVDFDGKSAEVGVRSVIRNSADGIDVNVRDGGVVDVFSVEDVTLSVFSIDGRHIVSSSVNQKVTLYLEQGLYVFKTEDVVQNVIVK